MITFDNTGISNEYQSTKNGITPIENDKNWCYSAAQPKDPRSIWSQSENILLALNTAE